MLFAKFYLDLIAYVGGMFSMYATVAAHIDDCVVMGVERVPMLVFAIAGVRTVVATFGV